MSPNHTASRVALSNLEFEAQAERHTGNRHGSMAAAVPPCGHAFSGGEVASAAADSARVPSSSGQQIQAVELAVAGLAEAVGPCPRPAPPSGVSSAADTAPSPEPSPDAPQSPGNMASNGSSSSSSSTTQSKQKAAASRVTLAFLDALLFALGYAKAPSTGSAASEQHQVSLTKVLRELNATALVKAHLHLVAGNGVVTGDSVLRGLQQTGFEGELFSASNVRSAKFFGTTNSFVLVDVYPPEFLCDPAQPSTGTLRTVGRSKMSDNAITGDIWRGLSLIDLLKSKQDLTVAPSQSTGQDTALTQLVNRLHHGDGRALDAPGRVGAPIDPGCCGHTGSADVCR